MEFLECVSHRAMEQLSEVKHTQTTNQLRRLHENEST